MRRAGRPRHRADEVVLLSAALAELGLQAAGELGLEYGENEGRIRLAAALALGDPSGPLPRRAGQLAADVQLELDEVDVAPAKGESLREPHPREGEQRDPDAVRLVRVAQERRERTLVQSTALLRPRPRPLGGVELVERCSG